MTPSALYDSKADALISSARLAASRPALTACPDTQWWDTAEKQRKWPLPWRVMHAGAIAAHLVRLDAHRRLEDDECPVWAQPVVDAVGVMSSPEADERFSHAMIIRRAMRFHGAAPDIEPARLLAAWLADPKEGTSGHLIVHIIGNVRRYRDLLAAGWYSLHGPNLVSLLAEQQPKRPGRPSAEDEQARPLLRMAVRGLYTARTYSKSGIAQLADISRPTLNVWLTDGEQE